MATQSVIPGGLMDLIETQRQVLYNVESILKMMSATLEGHDAEGVAEGAMMLLRDANEALDGVSLERELAAGGEES